MKDRKTRIPKFPNWLLIRLYIFNIEEGYAGDIEEEFDEILNRKGRMRAVFWIWTHAIVAIPKTLQLYFLFGGDMFKNNIKITLRNLKRHKGYNFINISGMATAFACCIFILLYVQFELSYDKYHQDLERLYRVSLNMKNLTGDHNTAASSPLFAPTLRENYPQVESAARLRSLPAQSVIYKDKMFFEHPIMYAEPEIFDIFTLGFVWGDRANALGRPDAAVLTQDVALRYFNDKNPLGEKISIGSTDYEVTAVIEDMPTNSHMRFGILLSMENITDNEREMHFHNTNFYTYIKLATGVDPEVFSQHIRLLTHDYFEKELAERNTQFICFLQPVKDIHLYSHLQSEFSAPGNPVYLTIFSLVGGLVLLIAGINFINLSTARSGQRSGEIGVRKVAGAHRGHLIIQYLGESVMLSFLALTAALVLVRLLLTPFNEFIGSQYSFHYLFAPGLLLYLGALVIFTGILAGSYSAFYLSALNLTSILKASPHSLSSGAVLRKILVVGQFAISILLIIATLISFRQLNFMKNRPLGFDKEQKLIVRLPRGVSIQDRYTALKTEFEGNPGVSGVTFSSTVPGRGMSRFWIWPTGQQKTRSRGMANLAVDYDFLSLYKIELLAGREFSRDMGEDAPGKCFILNEEAVKDFGWSSAEEALTKSLRDGGPVIGVAKNFHFQGLQTAIEPLILWIYPAYYGYMTLSVKTDGLDKTLTLIQDKFADVFPGNVMQHFFLDREFAQQYQVEERVGKLIGIFTFLGVLIACLGLFGLASFITERRSKEIGIRRVLGAPVSNIVRMLSREFIKWVMLANMFAWPMAYLAAARWLQGFAYRIDLNMHLYIFIFAALLALGIAIVTVFCQTVKAATANPVDSLRYE
jgi:putative ABC transport system permease protein